jgi:chemotaxis protein CheD
MRELDNGKERLVAGLGEMRVASGAGVVLVCVGLGSCVALCAYDPVPKIAGIGHMVLPHWREAHKGEPSPKFVDCGIPLLVREMEGLGAVRSRLQVKIVGGAQMIPVLTASSVFEVGKRNVESAQIVLRNMGLRLSAMDTGGTCGRTVHFHPDTGRIVVSTVGEGTREL